MALFGPPNVDKLAAKRDLKGLAKALTNRDAAVRDAAARALGEIDGPEAVPLVVVELTGQDDERVIETGAGALRAMGGHAVPVLVAGLRGAPSDKRPAYGALLGRLGEAQGLGPLLEASRDSDPGLRATAALSLGLIGTPPATERITELFRDDEDMDTRGMAALALASHKLAGAYETFVGALHGPDPMTRALAATGLGMLGDARAAESLRRVAAQDADERVRNTAQSALGDLET